MKNTNCEYIHNIWTEEINLYGKTNPVELVETYGSPLYVYSEKVLRERCRELKNIISYENFKVNYSAKANTNLHLLKIVKDEGLLVDAMSPGEMEIEFKAGYSPEEILFISNNVSDEELKYAISKGVLVSVDSLSQLESYGKLNNGGRVAVRINPGFGAGHHAKVITAGKNTKFGIEPSYIHELKHILEKYNLTLVGVNQHIGSLFMNGESYTNAAQVIFSFAEEFPELEFVDLGGGFGIPYRKEEGEERFDLQGLTTHLQKLVDEWVDRNQRKIMVKIEPGRYTVAECGVLLGAVHSVKSNADKTYVGTDLGFNVLMRRVLYNAHHDIEVYGTSAKTNAELLPQTIVGNICESGDILAKERNLPEVKKGDVLGVLDAGAYGMVMSSNYNCRLRPAEVLIMEDGTHKLIRRRDTFEDLLNVFPE